MDELIRKKKNLERYEIDNENKLFELLRKVKDNRKTHAHYRNLAENWE